MASNLTDGTTGHGPDGRSGRTGRWRALGAAAVGIAALALTSCTTGAPAPANPLAGGLTTRTVDVSVSGSASYAVDDAAATAPGGPTGFAVTYNSSSLVVGVDGTLGYGPSGSLALHLIADPFGMSGSATVTDPGSSVSVTVNGTVSGFGADSLGNVSGSISSGTTTVAFATTSVALPSGTDADLEALLAEEATFCQDTQQRLAGLDPAQVPLSAITDVRHSGRAEFAGSKSVVAPLTVQTWSDAADTTTAAGGHATISQHISCKTRAADHVATTGVTTGAADLPCSVINQRSIDLALARMTPAQQAAVHVPALGTDIVRENGSEWTTPLPANVEFDGTTLRAHALLTRWNDPNFAIFPDTIRGVHYCTTWSPAFAYTYLLGAI